jgi:hypothetical protein
VHTIEPYFNWRHLYAAEEDKQSPFYEREYSEFEFTHTIYNYYIHPQWDEFGSSTLYMKILFVDYINHFAILEFIGEWNDAIGNDIMFLKRDVIDPMIKEGIHKFILIEENVLNFHASDDCYYEEWYEDIAEEGGWIAALNVRDHIVPEMRSTRLQHYVYFGEKFNDINWRLIKPQFLPDAIEDILLKPLAQSNH